MACSASGSRGWRSSRARRSNNSSISSRSCGVIGRLHSARISYRQPRLCGGFQPEKNSREKIFWRRKGDSSTQGEAIGRQGGGQGVAAEIGIFPFALDGERIEPLQLVIHQAGMAHHHAFRRQPVQEAGKQFGEIRLATEIIGSGEGGVNRQSLPACPAPE